jgi:nucleotide-binding universal stress UspA family protein
MTRNRKIVLTSFVAILITYWHYATDIHHPFLHVLHRELYLIPIAFYAYWFGARAGIAAAVICSILFLPKVLLMGQGHGPFDINHILDVPMFFLVGFLVGKYRDTRKNLYTTIWEHEEEKPELGIHNILLCIDNSKNAFKAALYVAGAFCNNRQLTVTVVGFLQVPSAGLFSAMEEQTKAEADMEASITDLVKDANDALLTCGLPATVIKTRVMRLQNESISDKILEEQQKMHYDTIVVGGTKMSKAQEFVLGNMNVKLVREADCPVITVF